ncbi:hypothetical protein [Rhodococcus sp. HNM0569]|uniref:hypothetical protein n=1 Tax=Rhodococcus sp. HNM0569 TaxID=2716340 RepID=UPI00146C7828|nr:hypothetical protein [Rhodococcus sp. HNM0569]NLU84755.1 hypothetical protein [Rhodococcus sp. HNM0569]
MSNPYGDDRTRRYDAAQPYGAPQDPRYVPGSPAPGTPPGPRLDTGPFLAGVAATALVAAIAGWVLTAIMQALWERFEWGTVWAYGLIDPWNAAITGAIAAALSGLLMWLLVQGVPSPATFYSWITTLVVIAVVVLPFLAASTWEAALAAGIVHGALGMVVISLTNVVAGRTVHR